MSLLDHVWDPLNVVRIRSLTWTCATCWRRSNATRGSRAAAFEAATKAYRLAWCDGEPHAYHGGLVAAAEHLRQAGAAEPSMPPLNESKYEPMPEVEINPDDEFHVDVRGEVTSPLTTADAHRCRPDRV